SPNNEGTVTTATGVTMEEGTPVTGTSGSSGTSSPATGISFTNLLTTHISDAMSSSVSSSPNNKGTVPTATGVTTEEGTPVTGTSGSSGTSGTGILTSFTRKGVTQSSNAGSSLVSTSTNTMEIMTTGGGINIEQVTSVTLTATVRMSPFVGVTVASTGSSAAETTTVLSPTASNTLANPDAITRMTVASVQWTSSATVGNVLESAITMMPSNVPSSMISSTSQAAVYFNSTSTVFATFQRSTPTRTTYSNLFSSGLPSAAITTASVNIGSSSLVTTATTITTTITTYSPDACRNASNVALPNGTCVPNNVGQEYSAGILNSGNASSVDLANSLSLYVASINNANASSGGNSTVSISKIEQSLSKLDNISITLSSDSSFLIAQPLNHSSNDILLGARFQRGLNGSAVTISTENSSLNSNATAAAVISEQSLVNVKSLQMFIIDKPTMYENADNKTNKSLASSVVVGSVQLLGSASVSLNISLYFKISPEYQPNVSATYLCSFYDISNSCWNETGCTGALFNPVFSRYECSCNHLTAFAITWSAASVSDTTNNLISTNPVTRIDIDTSFESTSSTLTSLSSGNSTSSVTLATGIASTTEEVTNIVSTIKSSTVSSTGTTVASSTANSTATTVASSTATSTATTVASSTANSIATTVASSTANSTATTVASSTANSTATMMASSTTNNIATTINSRDNTTELVSSVQSTSSSTTTNITGTAARTGSITTVLITSVQSTASSTTANLVLSTVTSVSANVSTLTASSTGQSMSSNSVLSAFSSAPLTTISTSVASSSLFTTAATITTTISTYSPDTCRNSSNVALPNGTCVPYNVGQVC
ncbi:unnamed protein product, partial [Rotaria magnacalcarata]